MQNPKKFACSLCRRRKLKCDGQRPICMTCRRLGHSCTYEGHSSESRSKHIAKTARVQPSAAQSAFRPFETSDQLGLPTFAGSVLPLGLREPLPNQEITDALHEIFFDRIHPFLPVFHKPRYLLACQTPPNTGTPACLRYAVWALAASVSQKYKALDDVFYNRARSYIEADELKGLGLAVLTIQHVQCWSLLSQYESQKMAFPRAWMGIGRAARLAQMLGLHQLDKEAYISKRVLPPARDWTELETRRRTFWSVFHNDRWATCGTGWPVTIDDREISTNLPSSEQAYFTGIAETTSSLYRVRAGHSLSEVSSFGGAVLIADLIGRIREHLHFEKPPDTTDASEREEFWKRHVKIDNDLSSLFLLLPDHLKLPAGVRDTTAISINMNIHSLIISLHKAMISELEQYEADDSLISRSQTRCDTAAEEIINILRLISHADLNKMSPYTAFGLSVAATVFIRKAQKHGPMGESHTNLQLIRSAMKALKNAHPITTSFMLQLDLAMEASGLQGSRHQGSDTIHGLSQVYIPNPPLNDAGDISDPQHSSLMAEELKRHDALSISLDGILPVRVQKETPHPSTSGSPLDLPAVESSTPSEFNNTDTAFQLDDGTLSDRQMDEFYLMQMNTDTLDPAWDDGMLVNDLEPCNDAQFLVDPAKRDFPQFEA